MGSKPKAPKPTAQELELQRRQRDDLDNLTRDRNSMLKAIKRTLGGRKSLLGSGSERGVRSGTDRAGTGAAGGAAGAPGGRSGGILSSGAAGARASIGTGRVPSYRTPNRSTAV